MISTELLNQLRDDTKRDVAWESFVDTQYDHFFNFLKGQKIAEDHIDDIISDTLLSVYAKLDTLRQDSKFESWMWQILRNNMKAYFKDASKERNIMFAVDNKELENLGNDEPLNVKFDQEYDDPSHCVEEKLKIFETDAPDRHFVITQQMSGVSIKEIAVMIGREYPATKEYISQSKKKLEAYLKECYEMSES
jgi:RNA polymerase sigma-70 factor (ECF subfamily)